MIRAEAVNKPENNVTTFPLSNDIVDVATVEQQLEAIAVDIELTDQVANARIGQRLVEARDLFKYDRREGGFEGWVKSRLGLSYAWAHEAITRYQGLGPVMSLQLQSLSKRAQLETATAEPDVKAIIAERVEAGEIFTAAQVKDLKQQAAAEAVERINADAEKSKQDLAALRSELDAKDQKSADAMKALQASIEAQNAKIKAFEDQAAAYQKSLPKPAKAKEQAAETGGVVLGSDGKFHSGSSAEQKRMHDAFMFAFDKTLDLTENPPGAARVVAGCPQEERAKLASLCDGAIAYLNTIKDALNGQ